MLSGLFTEGRGRVCDNCGERSTDTAYCATCDMHVCDGCDHTCIPQEELN